MKKKNTLEDLNWYRAGSVLNYMYYHMQIELLVITLSNKSENST